MSNIVQVPIHSDVAAIKQISKLVTNHLIVKNILVAGFKVRNKIGGPIMLVQGFTDFIPSDYSSKSQSVQSEMWALKSYPKVQLNEDGLTYKEILGEGYNEKVPMFIFFANTFTSRTERASNLLFVVCKYWSENKGEFFYRLENLHELEIMQD